MHTQHLLENFSTHRTSSPQSRSLLIAITITTISLLLIGLRGAAANSIGVSPTPTIDRLATPVVPSAPTAIDLGRMVYYVNCMPCHGDRGQGLTDEWRAVWNADHQNCWARGCHSGFVEAEGYPLPRTIPAVIGAPPTLAHFQSADDLVAYLEHTHPPQRPGALSETDYRNVTAFVWSASGRSTPQADQAVAPIGLLIPIGLLGALAIFILIKRNHVRSIGLIVLLGLAALALSACGSTSTSTVTPIATANAEGTLVPELILTLTANRLDKPVMPANNPSQADKGAVTYWLVCIPCHGDKGQGLTDEWRFVFGVQEMNCWQSKCHAANHPEDGFQFPHTIPAVIGQAALARYTTAAELHQVIATRMPWYNPKVISAEDAWNLTAYLLRANGVLPNGIV
ncbi:MAG TPA: c-type cytochrome, partial [Anaerolineae bacterium]|nr:c-type cytochrome [Anaerolineae bacterium]